LHGTIVKIYNNNGSAVITEKLEINILQKRISLQKLAAGIYTVVCIADNKQKNYKLIVH